MSKSTKKKPVRSGIAPVAGKGSYATMMALHPGATGPSDAGRVGAKTGGKSASVNKGR